MFLYINLTHRVLKSYPCRCQVIEISYSDYMTRYFTVQCNLAVSAQIQIPMYINTEPIVHHLGVAYVCTVAFSCVIKTTLAYYFEG